MKKADLGTKRSCKDCGARFYDLDKMPVVCPKCGTSFVPEILLPPKAPIPSGTSGRKQWQRRGRPPIVTDAGSEDGDAADNHQEKAGLVDNDEIAADADDDSGKAVDAGFKHEDGTPPEIDDQDDADVPGLLVQSSNNDRP